MSALISAHALASPTVIALGDSLTDGYGIEKSAAFPALLETALKPKFPDLKIINAGISGSTSSGAAGRLKWFLKSKPDVLILSLGANDGLRGVDLKVTKSNLRETIKMAQDSKIKVLLAGMLLPPNYGEKYRKDFSQMYQDLAKEFKVTLYPFLLQDVALKPELNLADHIHPNEAGHKIIAKNLAPVLETLLK